MHIFLDAHNARHNYNNHRSEILEMLYAEIIIVSVTVSRTIFVENMFLS
jgi:hypothetical protein